MAHQPAKPQIHAYSLRFTALVLLFSLVVSKPVHSQNLGTRTITKAEQYLKKGDYPKAINLLNGYLNKQPNDGRFWLLLGEVALENRDTLLAIRALQRALSIDSTKFAQAWSLLGEIYLYNEDFTLAIKAFEQALQQKELRPAVRDILKKKLEISEMRKHWVDSAFPVQPINLSQPINSIGDDIPNSILIDGLLMLFTRKQYDAQNPKKPPSETFMVAELRGDAWSAPTPFAPWQSQELNMGAPTFSPDGQTLWFAGCGWGDGAGSCDIYVSQQQAGKWTEPVNAGLVINSAAWESQPSISSDGQVLIFASNRPGGYGGSDLWQSVKLPNGQWSMPQNLGPLINSAANEMAPFFHPDGQTLYFSSNGHPGMGGYDLFVSRLDEKGRWLKPTNLGLPFNTKADEINLITDAKAQKAYMASNRPGGLGGFDIYEIELPEPLRPTPLLAVHISVIDAETKSPLEANVSLKTLPDHNLLFEGITASHNGQLLTTVQKGKDVSLLVFKPGYFYFSEDYHLQNDSLKDNFYVDVLLQPAKAGAHIVLKSIHFDLNSAELLPESLPALSQLLDFLMQQSSVVVEISGHTDKTGTAAYNLGLSQQRAEAVVRWLISNGIDARRLVAKGYGAEQPRATNNTEEGRTLNRRTEVKILDNYKLP